jgi:sugar O-acyltransferase (sialic acid O-acetyltransferase NeuD family)
MGRPCSRSSRARRQIRNYDVQVPQWSTLIFGVASPYAWELVETAHRLGLDVVCFDNIGEADARLPRLLPLDHELDPVTPFVIGLASPTNRVLAAHDAAARGLVAPASLIDPTAVVASTTRVGHGSYVNAGVVLGSNTSVTCHVNINRSASIGHDNVLGFGASIGPGAVLSGTISIDAGAFIGAGATVLPEVRVGAGAIVGAGAVVTKNVGQGEVVMGNPARVVRVVDVDIDGLTCPHC